jgi:monooxygenase
MSTAHYDAIIIGAGISGISAAYHFQKLCPGKTYKILERRQQIGGTWDLFNYPGIRSDSDMYTFGFSFRPWHDESAIASKDKIIDYLNDTIDEYDIGKNIEFGVYTKKASWSSEEAKWQLDAVDELSGASKRYSSQHIFMCVGYYNYDHGYTPDFEGRADFKGAVIHPQLWPEDADYRDKNVVVIGSGATAVTLIPSMATKAAHVTMLQRSPTYMAARPAIDPKANWIAKWLGRRAARWWFIFNSMFIYNYCKKFPSRAKAAIIGEVKGLLGKNFEAKHFTPKYDPWDERLCLCPDGDLFDAINSGKASVVTDHIERFTESGIKLKSGLELAADMIVTATGLEILFLGGVEIVVDGQLKEPSQSYVYKGVMCNDMPNLYIATGYTNASWTLKVDLTNKYACRLINYMDDNNFKYCAAKAPSSLIAAPLLDLDAGYIRRGQGGLPMQGTEAPWKLYQNYIYDKCTLKFKALSDESMTFH